MDLDVKIYKKLQDFGVVGASYTIINELINMVDKDRAEQLELNASSLQLPNDSDHIFECRLSYEKIQGVKPKWLDYKMTWIKENNYRKYNTKNR